MRKKASAVIDNTRRFNIREGLTLEDDYLPKRFLTEALPETGDLITREQMVQLLKDYYRVRGWDEMGYPG
jgi:aldehyde:ferredoxin oxidoreductase